MSIYCTGYNLRLPVDVPCTPEEKDASYYAHGADLSGPGTPTRERWIEVYFQHVPNHINEENGYDDEWLPAFQHKPACTRSEYQFWFVRPYPDAEWVARPVDEGTPDAEMGIEHSCSCGNRCVFVLDEDNDQQEGQRYTNPLLVLSGVEYEAANFSELMGRIEKALEARYGVGNERNRDD